MTFKSNDHPNYRLITERFTLLSLYPDIWLQVKKKSWFGFNYWSSVWEGSQSINLQNWNPERFTNELNFCIRSYEKYLEDWKDLRK